MKRAPVLLVVAVLSWAAAPAWPGQIVDPSTGSIVGVVRDPTGAVVPDVAITVTGPALMTPRQASTDAAGAYRILRLPPGDYTLSFARQGFTVAEHTVRIGLGFTADLDVTLTLAAQRAEVVVTGGGVLDRHSAAVADTFDSTELEALPSSRSIAGVIGLAHGLYMPNMEVGAGLGLQAGSFSAYGRNSSPRHTIEGIVVTGLFGAGFTPDYGALEEMAVLTGAHGAEWPTAGIHTQMVTKSGGNRYAGSIYSAYENRHWQSSNVDADQIGRFAPSGGGLSARQANQVWRYRDVNADAGGFVVRDRLWWYSSIRDQEIATRLINFPVEPHRTGLTNYSGKVTGRVAPGHTLVAYGQRGLNNQPYTLDPFGPPGGGLSEATAINESIESTARQRNVSWLWKGEWNAVLNDSLLVDLRAGQFANELDFEPRSTNPRFEDIDTLIVSGGNRDTHDSRRRNQLIGAMSYFTDGRAGSHHLKAGGEAIRFLVRESWLSAAPGNVLHVMSGGDPSSVLLFAMPSHSEAGVWTYAAYASDSWRLKNRLTLTLGLRFDRYRVFLPAQEHLPSGQQFAAVPNLIDWNTFVPRIAAAYDLTGRGTTLAKFSFARYRPAPNAATGFNSNPNAAIWWTQYAWLDPNGSGVWEPGEESPTVQGRRGGVAAESVDPAMRLAVLDETGAWVEHELPARVGVRTGVVWRRERSAFSRQNLNRPFDAFTVPVQIRDPGPDGATGTTDDGATFTAYDLREDFLKLRPANVLTNVADSTRSAYWTWEISATRRSQGRWSLGAGFTHTWNRDHASGYAGQAVRANPYPFTPNDLINTGDGGAHEFTTWTAKAHGTYDAPWDLHITPVLRHQSGQPFGRTFTSQLNYATMTVLAEPVGTRRLDNITLLDLHAEKHIRLPGSLRLAAFLDVFNLLNANPEQNLIWSSGVSYARPLSIVSPRVAKVGLSLDW